MKQLTQKLKNGSMSVLEVPAPSFGRTEVLVRNHYSLVSVGTEGSTVKTARKGFMGKARERPQQVKQVLDVLKSQGPVQTYRAVMKKLDAHSPLGYSCAGEVIDVGEGVTGLIIGDRVACGGLSASHAEVVAVPVNLCVKLAPHADMKQAAYNTLGAIAMQGVRQADLRLGETCAVIGLGLIGQLTGQLLKAAGVRAVGIDVDASVVEVAAANGFDLAIRRDAAGGDERVLEYTGGIGCDAVIITAGSSSLDPINFAGALARKRGTIVVVGAVPTGFDREPHFYRKELQVRMSCSYGPGRYDPRYEEKGIDYPAAYVRWTEKRNMEAFQDLLARKAVDVGYLTTHTVKLEDAPQAYNMMMERSEPFIGILIEYDATKEIAHKAVSLSSALEAQRPAQSGIGIGFIGAGSYAQSHLLPNLPKDGSVVLEGVLTQTGTSSRSVAERFGFAFCTGDEADLFDNDAVNAVFVATRHDSHADYVIKALEAGKHVFVEKPLCLTEDELGAIVQALAPSSSGPPDASPVLMVGYNRRFSPLAQRVKTELGSGPMAMTYRVNAGRIPADSWIQDAESGGGRIIGEVCHFIDFLTWLNGSLPVSVHAHAMADPEQLSDTVTINLAFQNGSVGTIGYFANGDKGLGKERVEVFAHGCTAVLDDFRQLALFLGGREKRHKTVVQNKGQREEVRTFIDCLSSGAPPPIPYDELFSTSRVSIKALESIRTGKSMAL